jgi:hypothetical protein
MGSSINQSLLSLHNIVVAPFRSLVDSGGHLSCCGASTVCSGFPLHPMLFVPLPKWQKEECLLNGGHWRAQQQTAQ